MGRPPARSALWKSIAAELRSDICAGGYPAGARLPTEAEMAARFGVNRHTVRHALSHLVKEGTVHTRRGIGSFVAVAPTDYRLGKRVRFHQNLRAAGQVPAKTALGIETRRAAEVEARTLGLAQGEMVHVYDGLSLADGVPIAIFRSIFPAERLHGLAEILREEPSVTIALARLGVEDFTRRWTRLSAVSASPTQALHLRCKDGAPLLRSRGLNVDGHEMPVEYGTTWFSGERVTLTVESETLWP